MKSGRRRYGMVLALALVSAAAAEARTEDFATGLGAYNRGEFVTAFRIWYGLAEAGDARAQAGVGFMFHRGQGVRSNDREAAEWLRRGADQGQAEAQLMLGTLYFYGRGVPQSYVQAFAWCDLAQTHGQDSASLCRDSASDLLSSEQQKQAFAIVNEWMRTRPVPPK